MLVEIFEVLVRSRSVVVVVVVVLLSAATGVAGKTKRQNDEKEERDGKARKGDEKVNRTASAWHRSAKPSRPPSLIRVGKYYNTPYQLPYEMKEETMGL